MAKIKKESLVDLIYARLREDIITLKYPLGKRLNVSEIQEQLGVSSTPLREALNRLQQEGLVMNENNVGASVLTLDEHDVAEIEELAYTLQAAAVRFAMERGDRDKLAREIETQIIRYEGAKTARERVKAVHELIGAFYHRCGNRRLDKSMIAIQGQMLLLRHICAECIDGTEDLGLFQTIHDAVAANDADAVCGALLVYSQKNRPAVCRWIREHSS